MNDKVKYHEPFSPVIMESKVPDKFLKLIKPLKMIFVTTQILSNKIEFLGKLLPRH